MKETGEWGEFFPISLSPFGYNETVAQEYFPLPPPDKGELEGVYYPESQDSSLGKGVQYTWKEEEPKAEYLGEKVEIPDSITDVTDDILQKILTCDCCQKNYRLVKPELKFYRTMNLPVPRKCPNCRHTERMKLRNPRTLWKRECDKCSKEIESTFAPEREETVYCEECYGECIV